MTGYYLAISLLALFYIVEISLRYSSDARSLKTSGSDKGTTLLNFAAIISSVVFVVLSTWFRKIDITQSDSAILFWCGLILATSGLIIRIVAALTLKKYYTRTLMITEDHKLVKHGIYSVIRHPGYLGVVSLLIGCGMLTGNLITIALILLDVPVIFIRRIITEEKMLVEKFNEEYRTYQQKTFRLIPFLF